MAVKRTVHLDKRKNQLTFNFQVDLEDILNVEGGNQENLSDFEFRSRLKLKEVLDDAAKRSKEPLDRIEVAARLSRKLGREITKTHLDQWVALSAVQKRIHADTLKGLCEVLDDWRPLHFMVEACGFKMLDPDLAVCAEYGAKMLFKKMIDTDLKELASGVDEDALRSRLMQRMDKGKVR